VDWEPRRQQDNESDETTSHDRAPPK
jgi:hypothetical protein